MYQLVIWIFVVVVAKALTTAIVILLHTPMIFLSYFALDLFKTNEGLKYAMVMFVVPLIMSLIMVYIQDEFLRDHNANFDKYYYNDRSGERSRRNSRRADRDKLSEPLLENNSNKFINGLKIERNQSINRLFRENDKLYQKFYDRDSKLGSLDDMGSEGNMSRARNGKLRNSDDIEDCENHRYQDKSSSSNKNTSNLGSNVFGSSDQDMLSPKAKINSKKETFKMIKSISYGV